MNAASSPAGIDYARRLSARYFNLFRLVLAGVFLVAGRMLNLGSEYPALFTMTAFAYFSAVLALGFPDVQQRFGFDRVTALQVIIDVFVLALIMWTSGGYRSGMPVLMMIVLAGAGLVAEGRMVLFFAALTTVVVLAENTWRLVARGASGDFLQLGIICIGFFGIAVAARGLALRAKANATLAAERGRELAKQEAVNERIISDMQDGVIVIGANGHVRKANPQAAALLGLHALEALALTDIDAAFGKVLADHSGEGHLMRLGPAGRLLRCRAVHGETGSAAAAATLVYLTDFEDIQRKLQQSKLAALGRLTASMAHEIRNPLSAVTQAVELLEDEKRGNVRERLLRIINDNAHRIERMIRDVLALGRRDQAEPETLPLFAFVHELVEAHCLQGETERAVYRVEIDHRHTLGMDRTHLRQILDNLVVNARRYCSGHPGAVRIYSEELPGGRVALHVHDDGPGIEESTVPNLFEPFFTTHPKGTGLGLYIARELAEANDVELEVRTGEAGAHFLIIGRSQP